MNPPTQNTADSTRKKPNDKKVVGLFIGVSFFLLILVSLISAGIYYWFKNSNFSKKIAEEKIAFVDKLEEGLKNTEGQADGETAGPKEAETAHLSGETNTENKTESRSISKVEINIDDKAPIKVSQQTTCFKYAIYEGPFKSSKCYNTNDYDALSYYYSNYISAEFSKESAQSTIDFTCGKDYFKESCKNAKEDKEKAQKDMEKYSTEINQIISRGW